MPLSAEVLPLIGYFLLILALVILISPNFVSPISTPSSSSRRRSWTSSSYTYALLALLSLGFTWTYMFKYFVRSFDDAASRAGSSTSSYTIKEWLASTSLFVEAWDQVCATGRAWWWSEQLCSWTAGPITALWYFEGKRRNIKRSWAFMLLGQVVAISFSQNLFFLALSLAPAPPRSIAKTIAAPPLLVWSTFLSLLTVALVPSTISRPTFLPNLLLMHVLLLLPLLPISSSPTSRKRNIMQPAMLYSLYALVSASIRMYTYWSAFRINSPPLRGLLAWTIDTLYSHPAQSSIGFDVVFATLSTLVYVFNEERRHRVLNAVEAVVLLQSTPWLGIATSASVWLALREYRTAKDENVEKEEEEFKKVK